MVAENRLGLRLNLIALTKKARELLAQSINLLSEGSSFAKLFGGKTGKNVSWHTMA